MYVLFIIFYFVSPEPRQQTISTSAAKHPTSTTTPTPAKHRFPLARHRPARYNCIH